MKDEEAQRGKMNDQNYVRKRRADEGDGKSLGLEL